MQSTTAAREPAEVQCLHSWKPNTHAAVEAKRPCIIASYRTSALERKFVERSEYMLEYNIPIWAGEFGPIYNGKPESDAIRYGVLRDQLAIYHKCNASWPIWTYKDIGLQ